jgi:taurine transport system permease protein
MTEVVEAREMAPLLRDTVRPRRPLRAGPIALATLAGFLVLWWVAARFALVTPLFLPSPAKVAETAWTLARDGYLGASLLDHFAASFGRIGAAFLGSVLIGIPVGLAMGLGPIGRGIFDPIIEFIRPIPPLAYLPLVVIWCGIGEPSKILVIGIAMLAPIAIATAAGVRSAAVDRIDAARSLGATRRQVVTLVVLPSALPDILVGIRIALGAGASTLVAAELVAAQRGLGFMIESAANFLVTEVVIVGILVIAAMAFALEGAIRLVERRFAPWRQRR